MKTFDFIEAMIFHSLKDPHSKGLEPDCLSPQRAMTTQPLKGEGNNEPVIQSLFRGSDFEIRNYFQNGYLPILITASAISRLRAMVSTGSKRASFLSAESCVLRVSPSEMAAKACFAKPSTRPKASWT